ncbi:hypothetical protein MSG28_003424 [Choristoneura fumiferana]|uniref:Uncharacterized protein n=1 Tax=Choristoneura fumiferana TaxID=7141 RepID=A0ACC0KF21_CHOFU|nr:hypothetical protein MSG28_003424 [Choristoneura fumiferana]
MVNLTPAQPSRAPQWAFEINIIDTRLKAANCSLNRRVTSNKVVIMIKCESIHAARAARRPRPTHTLTGCARVRAGSPLKLVSAHKRIGRARPGGDGRPRGDRTRHAAGCRLPHVADALNRTHSHNNITMDIPTISCSLGKGGGGGVPTTDSGCQPPRATQGHSLSVKVIATPAQYTRRPRFSCHHK